MHITVWPPSLIHIWPLVGGQNDRETPDLVGAGGGAETGRSKQVGESGRERERETVCQERRENNGRREKTSQKV